MNFETKTTMSAIDNSKSGKYGTAAIVSDNKQTSQQVLHDIYIRQFLYNLHQQQQQQQQQQQRQQQHRQMQITQMHHHRSPVWIAPAFYVCQPLQWLCQYGGNDTSQRATAAGGQQSSVEKDGATKEQHLSTASGHSQKSSAGSKSSKGRNQSANTTTAGSSSSTSKRSGEKGHTHPWLVTTLKGHTDDIRDMDFSSNGKYLASCAEDVDAITKSHSNGHRNSATSDLTNSDDITSSSSSEDSPTPHHQKEKIKLKVNKSGRNRRQRKNQQQQQQHQNSHHHHHHRNSSSNDADDEGKETHQQPSSAKRYNNSGCRKQTSSKLGSSSSSSISSTSSSSSVGSSSFSTGSSKQRNFNSAGYSPAIRNIKALTRALTPPLRQHTKLNLPESELVNFLRHYIINPDQLRDFGYPIEYEIDQSSQNATAVIFKSPPRTFFMQTQTHVRKDGLLIINENDGLEKPKFKKPGNNSSSGSGKNQGTWEDNTCDNVVLSSGDSGQGSGSSSPSSVDSDNYEIGDEENLSGSNIDLNIQTSSEQKLQRQQQELLNRTASEKKCVRCRRAFFVTDKGQYVTKEECTFHWGKVEKVSHPRQGVFSQYSCCNGDPESFGCTVNPLHVWTGISGGLNGPFEGYVRTQPKYNIDAEGINDCSDSDSDDSDDHSEDEGRVFAIDCEMCFTGLGLELAKVTVIGADGRLVYEHFVRPESDIVDYNTRFSGITEKDLSSRSNNVKTVKEVQRDLLQLFNSDTILIGHALDNDLRVLKIIHKNIIDTSIAFPHYSGFPYRRSLKSLTKSYLKRDIQTCNNGHCSFEDSRACLELMLWRIRKDFRTILEQ